VLSISRDIAAPPEDAWALLVDTAAWPTWGPSIRRAELDGTEFGVGATGRVWTAVGLPLRFVVTECEAGRAWAWSVAGVRATRHRVEATDLGCRVTFAVPWWAPAYLLVCAVALRRIDDLLHGDGGGRA